jgi:formate dehydrogenase major subunit
MDEIARADADVHRRELRQARPLGSIQWPCNEQAPDGTPVMHDREFVRGKGRFVVTEYVPTERSTNRASR